ncbi:hypothetical protein L1987_16050 [Smallanthus sonchifolius]|uniref:Uncharacterized protein n=1 Tax=Smallanthus sonchifolius TaxID=185202 RepID=A0ACB9JAS0_9ASTR|nr:hypothetical protein L1987_16050 [Smallanthus sonchifolius]
MVHRGCSGGYRVLVWQLEMAVGDDGEDYGFCMSGIRVYMGTQFGYSNSKRVEDDLIRIWCLDAMRICLGYVFGYTPLMFVYTVDNDVKESVIRDDEYPDEDNPDEGDDDDETGETL